MANSDTHLNELLEKAKRFCAYRERCTLETSRKLKIMGGSDHQTEIVLSTLKDEGFLNEQRFADVYANGKFENNHWGKVKIRMELLSRNVSDNMISHALAQIPEKAYRQVLKSIAQKKYASLKSRDAENCVEKTVQYCLQKGFEADLSWQIVKEL